MNRLAHTARFRYEFCASTAMVMVMVIATVLLHTVSSLATPPDAPKKAPEKPSKPHKQPAPPEPKTDKGADSTAPDGAAKQVKKVRVEDILDDYIKATGGKEAYAKLQNQSATGTYELVGTGVSFNMTLIAARPNKHYAYFVSDGKSQPIEAATDGVRAWNKNGRAPATFREGDDLLLFNFNADYDREVDWRSRHKGATFGGVEDVEGRSCYKIHLTPKRGFPETRYYDVESKLLAKKEQVFDDTGDVMTTLFHDYKKVDGILFAHEELIDYAGNVRLKRYLHVEHNVEIRPDQFDPPPYPDPRY